MSTKKKLSGLKNEELDTKGIKGGGSSRKHDVLANEVGKTMGEIGKAKGGTMGHTIGLDDSANAQYSDGSTYDPKK